MNNKNKAQRHSFADRDDGQAGNDISINPQRHYSIVEHQVQDCSPIGKKILSLLQEGRHNARTTEELCKITGLHRRELQKQIHELREQGKFIISLSDVRGYFLPADKTDIAVFVSQMKSRAEDCMRAIAPAQEFLNNGHIL